MLPSAARGRSASAQRHTVSDTHGSPRVRVRYAVANRIHTDEAVNPEARSTSGRSTQVLEGTDHTAKNRD